MAELEDLKQISSVTEYYDEFVFVTNRMNLPDDYRVYCFMYGLDVEIRCYVNMFDPKTLDDAYSLAKIQEFKTVEIAIKDDVGKVFDEMPKEKFDEANSNSVGEALNLNSGEEEGICSIDLNHISEYHLLNDDNEKSIVKGNIQLELKEQFIKDVDSIGVIELRIPNHLISFMFKYDDFGIEGKVFHEHPKSLWNGKWQETKFDGVPYDVWGRKPLKPPDYTNISVRWFTVDEIHNDENGFRVMSADINEIEDLLPKKALGFGVREVKVMALMTVVAPNTNISVSLLAVMFNGVGGLTDVVAVIIGPKQFNIAIRQGYETPKVVKDGVIVAHTLELNVKVTSVCVSLVKQTVNDTNDLDAGGSGWKSILTYVMFSYGCNLVADSLKAIDPRHGILIIIDTGVTHMKSIVYIYGKLLRQCVQLLLLLIWFSCSALGNTLSKVITVYLGYHINMQWVSLVVNELLSAPTCRINFKQFIVSWNESVVVTIIQMVWGCLLLSRVVQIDQLLPMCWTSKRIQAEGCRVLPEAHQKLVDLMTGSNMVGAASTDSVASDGLFSSSYDHHGNFIGSPYKTKLVLVGNIWYWKILMDYKINKTASKASVCWFSAEIEDSPSLNLNNTWNEMDNTWKECVSFNLKLSTLHVLNHKEWIIMLSSVLAPKEKKPLFNLGQQSHGKHQEDECHDLPSLRTRMFRRSRKLIRVKMESTLVSYISTRGMIL